MSSPGLLGRADAEPLPARRGTRSQDPPARRGNSEPRPTGEARQLGAKTHRRGEATRSQDPPARRGNSEPRPTGEARRRAGPSIGLDFTGVEARDWRLETGWSDLSLDRGFSTSVPNQEYPENPSPSERLLCPCFHIGACRRII